MRKNILVQPGQLSRIFLLVALMGPISQLAAQDFRIGLYMGQWQPNTLQTEPTSSVFAGTADSSPYLALHWDFPFYQSVSIHASFGRWAHVFRQKPHRGNTLLKDATLIIIPLEFGVEHDLIEDFPLSPYVLYGGGILLADKVPGDRVTSFRLVEKPSVGFDLFLITGFQFTVAGPVGLDVNFGYIIAALPENLGVGKDYSGIRALLGLYINY
jgi:hypothetical protein